MTPIKSSRKLTVKDLVYLGNCGRRWREVNDKLFIKFVDEGLNYHHKINTELRFRDLALSGFNFLQGAKILNIKRWDTPSTGQITTTQWLQTGLYEL